MRPMRNMRPPIIGVPALLAYCFRLLAAVGIAELALAQLREDRPAGQ